MFFFKFKIYYHKFINRLVSRKNGIPSNIWRSMNINKDNYLIAQKKNVLKVKNYHSFNAHKLNINNINFFEDYISLFKKVQFMTSSNYEHNQLYLCYLADKLLELSYNFDENCVDFELVALVEILLGRDYSETEYEFNSFLNKNVLKRIKRPESVIQFYEDCINLKSKTNKELSKNFYSNNDIIHFFLEYYKNSSLNSPRFYFLFFFVKSNMPLYTCLKFNDDIYKKVFDFSCETLYDYSVLCNFYEQKIKYVSQKFIKSFFSDLRVFFINFVSGSKYELFFYKFLLPSRSWYRIWLLINPYYIIRVLPYFVSSVIKYNILNIRLDFKQPYWFQNIPKIANIPQDDPRLFSPISTSNSFWKNIVSLFKNLYSFLIYFSEEVFVDSLNFSTFRKNSFVARINRQFFKNLRSKKYGFTWLYVKKYHKTDFENFELFRWDYLVYWTFMLEKQYGSVGFDLFFFDYLKTLIHLDIKTILSLKYKTGHRDIVKKLNNLFLSRYNVELKYLKLQKKIAKLGFITSFFYLFFYDLFFKFNIYSFYYRVKKQIILFFILYLDLKLRSFHILTLVSFNLVTFLNSFEYLIFYSKEDVKFLNKNFIIFSYMLETLNFLNKFKWNNKNLIKWNKSFLTCYFYLFKVVYKYFLFHLNLFLNKFKFDLKNLYNNLIFEINWFFSFSSITFSSYVNLDKKKYSLNLYYTFLKNLNIRKQNVKNIFFKNTEIFFLILKKSLKIFPWLKNIIKIIKNKFIAFIIFFKNKFISIYNFIIFIFKFFKSVFFRLVSYFNSVMVTQIIVLKVFLRFNKSLTVLKAIKFYFIEFFFACLRVAILFIPVVFLSFYINDFANYLLEFEYLSYLSTCHVYGFLWGFIYFFYFLFFFPYSTFIRNISIPKKATVHELTTPDFDELMDTMSGSGVHSFWVIDITSEEWPKVQKKLKKYPEIGKYIKTNIKDLEDMGITDPVSLKFSGYMHEKAEMSDHLAQLIQVECFDDVLHDFDEIIRNYRVLEFEYENPERWREEHFEFDAYGNFLEDYVPVKGYEEVYKKSVYYFTEAEKMLRPDNKYVTQHNHFTEITKDPKYLNTYYRRTLIKNEIMKRITLIHEEYWRYPGFCKLLNETYKQKYIEIIGDFRYPPKDDIFNEEIYDFLPNYCQMPCFLPHSTNTKVVNEEISPFKNMLPLPRSLIVDTNRLMSVRVGFAPEFFKKYHKTNQEIMQKDKERLKYELGEDLSLEEVSAWLVANEKKLARSSFWSSMALHFILLFALYRVTLWWCVFPDGEEMLDPFFNVWEGCQYSIDIWFANKEYFDFWDIHAKDDTFWVEHKQTSLIFDKSKKPMYKSTTTYSRMTQEEFENYKVDKKTVEFKRNIRQREVDRESK